MDKHIINILVVDDNDGTGEKIIKIIDMVDHFKVVGEAVDGVDALNKTRELKPDVILMDINMPIMNGLESTEEISKEFPNIVVIIMSVQDDTDYLKKAMLCGAKEYIFKPFTTDDLINTVSKTFEKNLERKIDIKVEEKNELGKVISFFSTKGGVGKSVLAFNYALKLNELEDKKVILVDGDFLFGDVGILVDEKPLKTIYNIIEDQAFGSFDLLKEYIISTNENISVLLSPKRPENAEYITNEHVKDILKLLKENFDYIIVDLGTNFNNSTLTFLDYSDYIYIISLMDLMSIKNTKLGIEVMQSLDYDKEKVKIIINKFRKNGNINIKNLAKHLNYPIYYKIPYDKKIIENSVSIGKPVSKVSFFSKSKFEKALIDFIKKSI